jgi:hypothetical protein
VALAAAVLLPLAHRTGALAQARRSGVACLGLVAAVQVAGPFILIVAAEDRQAPEAQAGGHYVDVDTSKYPDGAVRGQLSR